MGLYLVAKGGGYAGSYDASKRSGAGVMRLPDGGLYQGQFAGAPIPMLSFVVVLGRRP